MHKRSLALIVEENAHMSPFPQRVNMSLSIVLCAALFIACSGGGANVSTSTRLPQSRQPALATQSGKTAQANVTFAIGITPSANTGHMTADYVSPSTQSLEILTDGANRVVVNLTPSSPNCSPQREHPKAYICTAALHVLTGNHIFTVTTYDATGATGNVLSTNSTGPVFVKPTGMTTVGIVLAGDVQRVVLTLANSYPPIGTAAAIGLTVSLQDADGNLIFGAAPYEHPVTLTTTDSANGLLSKTVLNSPRDASGITANYNGADVASITYSATAVGLLATNVSNAVLSPTSAHDPFLYRFPGAAAGSHPNSALLADRAGNLYGTTSGGGTANQGSVFKLTRSGSRYAPSVLYSFGSFADDGTNPVGGLIADGSGALYGATSGGGVPGFPGSGIPGVGTVFKLKPMGSGYTESVLYSFAECGVGVGTDACVPAAGVVADKTGALYGTTQYGGWFGEGAIFKLTPAGTGYTDSVLESFSLYGDTGYGPAATLMEWKGVFYGTTSTGDDTSCFGCGGGAVFALTPAGTSYNFSVLYRFGGYATDGSSPSAVIADDSGALYGTTSGGGANGFGIVFKLTPTASGYTESVIYNFKGGSDGAVPVAGLIADATGALYGTTQLGGSSGGAGPGTVFKLAPTKTGYDETILYRFDHRGDATNPVASLIKAAPDALYGTASNGGSGFGGVFKLSK
jgi:uncharacterized repeat protein (TIGR03803 family)